MGPEDVSGGHWLLQRCCCHCPGTCSTLEMPISMEMPVPALSDAGAAGAVGHWGVYWCQGGLGVSSSPEQRCARGYGVGEPGLVVVLNEAARQGGLGAVSHPLQEELAGQRERAWWCGGLASGWPV